MIIIIFRKFMSYIKAIYRESNYLKKYKLRIESNVTISCDPAMLGEYSFIGKNSILGPNLVRMGKFCSIASGVIIGPNIHPLDKISTAAVFYSLPAGMSFQDQEAKRKLRKKSFNSKPTIVGNDVWIGVNAIVLSGVKIGDGAVIGAGSVVTKDVGAYEIVAGNPAVLIRKRFSDGLITKIDKLNIYKTDSAKLIDFINLHFEEEVNEFLHSWENSDFE